MSASIEYMWLNGMVEDALICRIMIILYYAEKCRYSDPIVSRVNRAMELHDS